MAKSMLLLTKNVLHRVSFDVQLFYKELEKAYRLLLPHELKELHDWLLDYVQNKPDLRECRLNLI